LSLFRDLLSASGDIISGSVAILISLNQLYMLRAAQPVSLA